MSTNYEINKKTILNDYYKCIGAYENCELLYNENYLKIKDTDSVEDILIKKGRKEDLLSNLGKVGEKAFKYIYGLEILKTYPNIDANSFETFFRKENALKDFAEKHGISRDDERIINLLNYSDANNQKAHNFDYWFSIIKVIMDSTRENLKKFMEYKLQTKMLIKYCEDENEYIFDPFYKEYSLPFLIAIFPGTDLKNLETIPSLKEKQLNRIIKTKREVIRNSGDIFTRFRYASNNPDNLVLSLDKIFDIITDIKEFIELVHNNNDNLDLNLEKEYAKKILLEYKDKLDLTEEEIKGLCDLDIDLEPVLANGYNYTEVRRLLNIGISKEELPFVLSQRLNTRNILFFRNIGITDYITMREKLDEYILNGEIISKKGKL